MSARRRVVGIVEDDSRMLKATQTLLDAHGFGSVGFSSAEDYFHRNSRMQLDCLLVDIHLGGQSGIELRLRLADQGSKIPVIFMTALDDNSVRREAVRAGCVTCLLKPFQAQQLLDALTKAQTATE